MRHEFCKITNIPEEVYYNIPRTLKVERLVAKLLTYKRLGIQVVHLSGTINKLENCVEILEQVSKNISIFCDNAQNLSIRVKRCLENEY